MTENRDIHYSSQEKNQFDMISFMVRFLSVGHNFFLDYLMYQGSTEFLWERVAFISYVCLYVSIRGGMYFYMRYHQQEIPDQFMKVTIWFDVFTMVFAGFVYGITIINLIGYCLILVYGRFLYYGKSYTLIQRVVFLAYLVTVFGVLWIRPEYGVLFDNPMMTIYLYLIPGVLYYYALDFLVCTVRRAVELKSQEVQKEQDIRADFIATSAHRLRTPLSGVKWAVEGLLDGDQGTLNTNQQDMLRRVYQANEDVIESVNGMLQLLREDSDEGFEYHCEQVSLTKVLDTTLLHHQVLLKDWQIERDWREEYFIWGDYTQLVFVFENIMSNAIKYSRNTHKLIIHIEEQDDYVITSIKDFGVGIPDSDQAFIFQRYFRASNVKEQSSTSSGIGMSAAKRIVTDLAGELWFESRESQGTTFYVKLPRTKKKS